MILFRPIFTPADMLISTTAGSLALSGHWLASIPVAIVGVLVAHYGRKRLMRTQLNRSWPRG